MSVSHPADVLALRSRGERLGADDGVPSHEGDLLVDVRAALLRSDHRAVVGRQQVVHARLLVDLHKENEAMKSFSKICFNQQLHQLQTSESGKSKHSKQTAALTL